ncbi:NifB/NifX family molybdenum-iron cluster-binding protein [Fusibacter sp. JL298sf-3]
MRVVLPVEGEAHEAPIAKVFGRAPYFLIVDTVTSERQCVVNPAQNSEGGAGVQAAQCVVDMRPEAVVAPQYGRHAQAVFNGSSVALYHSKDSGVEETLKALANQALTRVGG